ncbi:MAG: hypothetical protein WKF31_02930 [Thermoleophilaceae bacterium]
MLKGLHSEVEPTFQASVEKRIRTKMDLIRREGNAAVHRPQAIQAETSLAAVRELFHVLFWLARAHAREGGQAPSTALRFDRRRSRGRRPESMIARRDRTRSSPRRT